MAYVPLAQSSTQKKSGYIPLSQTLGKGGYSDADLLAAALIGEAKANRQDIKLVADTIANRATRTGKTPLQVISAPNQYMAVVGSEQDRNRALQFLRGELDKNQLEKEAVTAARETAQQLLSGSYKPSTNFTSFRARNGQNEFFTEEGGFRTGDRSVIDNLFSGIASVAQGNRFTIQPQTNATPSLLGSDRQLVRGNLGDMPSQSSVRRDFSVAPKKSEELAEAVNPLFLSAKLAVSFLRTLQTETLRSFASAAITARNNIKRSAGLLDDVVNEVALDPQATPFEKGLMKILFGDDRPLESIGARVDKTAPQVAGFLEKHAGYSKEDAEKRAEQLSWIGVGATVGLDFTGLGGTKKGFQAAVKSLGKADEISDVVKILKNEFRLADDVVEEVAPRFVALKNADEIEKELLNVAKLQDEARAIDTTIPRNLADESADLTDLTRSQAQARGRRLGRAEAENIAANRLQTTVRKQELKLVREGVRMRDRANRVIDSLRGKAEFGFNARKGITDFAKEWLPKEARGKALTTISNAKTPRDLTKAFVKIMNWAEDAEKANLRSEILDLQKKINNSPSIAVDYKDRVKEVLSDVELKGHQQGTIDKLQASREFFAREANAGKDVAIPQKLARNLAILEKTPFDELTINQLEGLKAEMELLDTVGRAKQRSREAIWEAQKSHILDSIDEQVIKGETKPINQLEVIRPLPGERLTTTDKFKNFTWEAMNKAARFGRAIMPMDTFFDLLDGGKGLYSGALYRNFKGRVDLGFGRYVTRKNRVQADVIELATKYKLKDPNFERMGVVAAREQDGGIEKLVATGLTQDQINAIKLTKEEQEVLDLMRATFDKEFPEIEDVMRRVYNQPVEKVKNYFSFMTDWKVADEAEVFRRFGASPTDADGKQMWFGAPTKNVETGFTKSRKGGGVPIRLNALDVFLKHTDNTSYLIELGETTKMLGEIANTERFAEAVGKVGQVMTIEWLDTIARKGGAAGAKQLEWLDMLRRNIGAGVLGLKLSTIAIQPTAFIDGMGFIGANYGITGMSNFLGDPSWRKFVLEMPEIKERMGGEFALRELTDDNFLQAIQRKGFIPMQFIDQIAAGAIAAGAYARKMKELGRVVDLSKYDDEALSYAQLAVRRTQSSGQFKDVPMAISRGAISGNRSLDRAMLQFQNFMLTQYSRIRHDAIGAAIKGNPSNLAPILAYTALSALAASGIRMGVNEVQDFITGKEDDKDNELLTNFSREMVSRIPFVGNFYSTAVYDGEPFPVLDAPVRAADALHRAFTAKTEEAQLKAITDFIGSVGTIAGVPGSTQGRQLVRDSIGGEQQSTGSKKFKLPPGLPELPTIKNSLPTPPGLPRLPQF